MSKRSSNWPAPRGAMTAARELLAAEASHQGRVIVAPDRDVDGLAAGALAIRALERMGAIPIPALPAKGEHVHTPAMRARLAALQADALVVLDMGSRRGPIVEGLPTVVVDHHDAREAPTGVVFVSAAGCEPVAPTGLLTYELLRPLADLDDVAWLAVVATLGDLGEAHPFSAELGPVAARYKKTHLKETVALINAARRASGYRPELALAVSVGDEQDRTLRRGSLRHHLRGRSFISRTARSSPTKIAREMIECPMLTSASPSMSRTSWMFT